MRILDTVTNEYLDEYENSAYNYVDRNGKQHGRSHSDFLAYTHFRIKKREEE